MRVTYSVGLYTDITGNRGALCSHRGPENLAAVSCLSACAS